MIELKKAIEIVKTNYPQFQISNIGKINGGWLFGFTGEHGEKVYMAPTFVSENTGEVTAFNPLEHEEELQSYEPIENDEG